MKPIIGWQFAGIAASCSFARAANQLVSFAFDDPKLRVLFRPAVAAGVPKAHMNTEPNIEDAERNNGLSAGQQGVAEIESCNNSPDSSPRAESSELLKTLLKAMYYWVHSRF